MAADLYSATVLLDAPTAYYRLDDTGTTAVDFTGNGSTLAVGASVTKSSTGLLAASLGGNTAMTFPNIAGTANCCSDAARVAALEGTTISLEAWIKMTTLATATPQYILAYGTGLSAAPYVMYAYSPSGSTFEIACDLANVGGSQLETLTANSLVVATAYHIAFTYDGITGRFYVNGVANGTTARSGTIAGYTGAAPGPVVGQMWTSTTTTTQGFNGVIDEAAIYANTVLTPAQVMRHYQVGVGQMPIAHQSWQQRAPILAQ